MRTYNPTEVFNRIKQRLSPGDNECLNYTGSKNKAGYGTLYAGGKYVMPHRVTYEAHIGDIPPGFVVCHKCDNPSCCNPGHLFTASQADNLADMRRKNRHSKGRTHAEAIKKGWTGEKRKRRAEQTKERMTRKREQAAVKAGVPVDWKFCPRCNTWFPRSNFHKNKARHDGLKQYCKPCYVNDTITRRRDKNKAS